MSSDPTNTSDDAQDPVVGSQPATPGDAQPHAQESTAADAAAASASAQGEGMGEVDMSDFEETANCPRLSTKWRRRKKNSPAPTQTCTT